MSDLISRSALLQEVKSLTVRVMGLRAGKGILNEYAKQYRETLLRIIDEQPAIEAVEVVHGRLVSNGRISARCSECNYLTLETEANFCPDCGARMDLKES